MVNVSIDVTDLGGEARPGDKVVFWRPRMGGSATHAGRVISTAPVTVFLTDGKATVSDVEPGEMTVLLQCRGVESQGPITVGVPDGTGTVTLRSLIESQFEYAPPIVSAVQEAAANASASEEAAIRAQVRSERAADRADAKVDDAINNGANLVRGEVKQDADRAVSARQAAVQSETNAKASESAAATSESNAKTSETNAKQSETNAGDFAAVATTAATEAVDAMEVASEAASSISDSVSRAAASADSAAQSETNAAQYESSAAAHAQSATEAATKVGTAAQLEEWASAAQEAADRVGTAEQVGTWASESSAAASRAAQSESNAKASEEAAASSAIDARASKDAASGSAIEAGSHAESVQENVDQAKSARDEVVPLAGQVAADASTTAAHRAHVDDQVSSIDTAFTESIPPYLQTDSPGGLKETYASSDLVVSVADPRFGAVADWDGSTGTDNTSAIRAAISHSKSLGPGAVLLYPQGPGLGYYVSETIEHGADLSVDMRAPICHPGGAVTVRFGDASKVTDTIAHYTIRVRRVNQSDWTDPSDVGVEFINIARTRIDIPYARGFTTNVRFIGDGQGFVVCTTTLGLILNGRCGIDLHSRNGGWVNSNLILGGYVLNHVGLNKGMPRCAVKYSSSTGFYNDGNIFDGLVAELKVDDAEGAEVEVIRAEYAQSNQHTNVRSETSGSVAIRNLNDSRFNNISLAYSQTTVGGSIDNSAAVRDTGHVTELRTLDRSTALRSVWRIDEMHKKAATYNGTTNIHIPGVSWRASGNANAVRSMSSVDVQPEYISVRSDRAVGVFISTRDIKRLLLSAHTHPSSSGRWVIKAFNSSGEVIENESAVKRGAVISLQKFTYFGGSWITADSATEPVDFTVSDEVDHVWVGLAGQPGNPALVTSMEVLTESIKKTRAWQEWDDRGMNWGTAMPTTGTYEAGRTIMNVTPSPGSPIGWICVTGGTPGTWVSLGDIPVGQ